MTAALAAPEKSCLSYEGQDSPKGKVWIATVDYTHGGIHIEFGAKGQAMRTAYVPPRCFHANSAQEELVVRRDEKLRKGYGIDHESDSAADAAAHSPNGWQSPTEGSQAADQADYEPDSDYTADQAVHPAVISDNPSSSLGEWFF